MNGGAARAVARELAGEALRLAMVDPGQAARIAGEAEESGLSAQDWWAVSVARRARGVAAIQRRELDLAVDHLRSASRAAVRAGSPRLSGEALMSLASALVLRGDPAGGFAAIEEALQGLTGPLAARARTQRAALLQEMGRVDEALVDLRTALPVLRRAGDAEWEARALSNRSLLHGDRRQFGAAVADLMRARDLCARHGLTLQAAYVEHNLGSVHADRGNVPVALQHFDEADARYRERGMRVGALLVDRARVLLSVRLVSEARAAAEAAVQVYTDQHGGVHLPEAQLMLSTVALLDQDLAGAVAAARAAAQGFRRVGRTESVVLARHARLQAEVAALTAAEPGPGGPPVGDRTDRARLIAGLRRSAAELEQRGWRQPALESRILAGRLALEDGRPRVARTELAKAAQARRSGPADVRARAWLAEAMLRRAEGRRRGCVTALRAGVRVVEDYQASIGAAELRAHVSVLRGSLTRMGLELALQDGDPGAVHWWSERGRAMANRIRPVRPPDDPVLARDLHELRSTMGQIDRARAAGGEDAELVDRQVRLEHRIRDRWRRLEARPDAGIAAPPDLAELAECMGEMALVEYVGLAGELHAVTLAGGRAVLHHLGSDRRLRHWMAHLPFALHRLAHASTVRRQLDGARMVLQHAARELDGLLLEPLLAEVGERGLVLAPSAWMQSVPWSVLPGMRGRPVTVAPSSAFWASARRGHRAPGHVVSVAGPQLPGAVEEAEAVAALHHGTRLLTGPAATSEAVGDALVGASIAHIAAHGTVRSDNPLFSSLLLADGPFTVYDLDSVPRTPEHVVLAACGTALSQVTAGEELLGLAGALLAHQTSVLVAPVVPVPDAQTVGVMTSYHRLLAAGRTPAQALAETQQQHLGDERADAAAAGFVCLGAGHDPVRVIRRAAGPRPRTG